MSTCPVRTADRTSATGKTPRWSGLLLKLQGSRNMMEDGNTHGVETDGSSVVVKLQSPHRLVIVTPAFLWLKPHNLIYIIMIRNINGCGHW